MESSSSGGGEPVLGFKEIEISTKGLERSAIFHFVKAIAGFILYMHHQIPSILQQLENEFDALKDESKNLESLPTQTDLSTTSRRKHNGRIREVKLQIRRMEKLMNAVSTFLSAFQLMLNEIPYIEGVILVLGASVLRPKHVYELFFSCGTFTSGSAKDCTKSRVAEALSRKAIRALVSNGSGSYAGPAKLFLLVKASATLNLPQHFLPKRDFRYNKRIIPTKLHIKCSTHDHYTDGPQCPCQAADAINLLDSISNDSIWFQCRHSIKGLASNAQLTEE